MAITRYYVDTLGNYLGGYSTGSLSIPIGALEVPAPPPTISTQIWDPILLAWGLPPVLTPLQQSNQGFYISPLIPIIPGSTTILAHTLSFRPNALNVTFVNIIADLGYIPGEKVLASVKPKNLTVISDTINFTVLFKAGIGNFKIINKLTGLGVDLTEASWNIQLVAFA